MCVGGGGGGGATGLLNKGGGSNRLPALVTKQQAVEFPQVLTSKYIITVNFTQPWFLSSVSETDQIFFQHSPLH